MFYYILLFIIFLLVAQFAFYLLPFLLPLFLIFFVISLFKRPNVRVYTQSYTFDDSAFQNAGAGSGSSKKSGSEMNSDNTVYRIETRKPLENSIDAEFTEYDETGEPIE